MKLCHGTTENDSFFCSSFSKGADSQFWVEQHFGALCLFLSPAGGLSHAVLGNYICLLCYVPGIKLWKLFWIVKHLFLSFSFSVCPGVSMLCVCVCVKVRGEPSWMLIHTQSRVRKAAGQKSCWMINCRVLNINLTLTHTHMLNFLVIITAFISNKDVKLIMRC